jgi:hypothetical protein
MRILGEAGAELLSPFGAGGTGSRSTVRHGRHYQSVDDGIRNQYAIRRDLVEHLPGGGITFQTSELTGEGVVYQTGVSVKPENKIVF